MASVDWSAIIPFAAPLFALLGAGVVILLLAPFAKKAFPVIILIVSGVSLAYAFFAAWAGWMSGAPLSLGLMIFDRMAYGFDFVLLIAALLTIFLSKDYLPEENIKDGEYYALILFATAGGMIIAHAGDLMVLFLGLEVASLSAYILSGMKRNVVKSYEASLKYFIMGSIASGFFLYGIAMAYGAAGSTAFAALQKITLPPAEPVLVYLAVALILIGVGFKIAAVPFHLWSPDVYEGAPTSVTAYMATAIKTAGFAALIRIVLAVGHIPQIPWTTVLSTLAVLTMTVGNLVALRQHNIKRMLAYSSIAHAGYVLVGVAAALQKNAMAESTLAAVLFYLFAYSLMTIGAFAVVIAIGRRGDQAEELTDYAGLAEKHPYLAAAMALFLFSLTGMPPTIGFVGKFYLFSGAIEAGLYGLVIVGVLNSVVSAYYYLGPIVKMYFQKRRDYALPPLSYTLVATIFLCVFVILYLGLFPSNVFLMARESVREIIF
jgi:NADH-quinone oxidoreductase subunit N